MKVKRIWDGKVVEVTETHDGKYKDCQSERVYDNQELDFECHQAKYCKVGETISSDQVNSFAVLVHTSEFFKYLEEVDKRPKNIQLPCENCDMGMNLYEETII